ncbi:capsid protein [Chifec genomovirus UA13_96]|nr:capsid protein [Chifec genomovirus UA13_96]
MAYKSYAKRRPTRRSSTKKRPSGRRRSYAKKRSTFRSKKMSTKRILNLTAQKKRDTMLCWTNSTGSTQAGGSTYSTNAAVINGGVNDLDACTYLWCATNRDNTQGNGGGVGNKFNVSTRTSSSPYMVGLSEKIEIQCNTGMPWQWRRICFTMKGPSLLPTSTASGQTFSDAAELSTGWARMMNQSTGSPTSLPKSGLTSILFKGTVNSDWLDPMTAPTDNSRVSIKYDKVVTLASGNEDGFIRTYKRWHPMRKTLYYNDSESGGAEVAAGRSVLGKQGMGDYYVVDLFRARQGSASTDQLTVRPEATLYWHEK